MRGTTIYKGNDIIYSIVQDGDKRLQRQRVRKSRHIEMEEFRSAVGVNALTRPHWVPGSADYFSASAGCSIGAGAGVEGESA
jgi:hypothetical protein